MGRRPKFRAHQGATQRFFNARNFYGGCRVGSSEHRISVSVCNFTTPAAPSRRRCPLDPRIVTAPMRPARSRARSTQLLAPSNNNSPCASLLTLTSTSCASLPSAHVQPSSGRTRAFCNRSTRKGVQRWGGVTQTVALRALSSEGVHGGHGARVGCRGAPLPARGRRCRVFCASWSDSGIVCPHILMRRYELI